MNPLAPVTSVFGTAGSLWRAYCAPRERRYPVWDSSARWQLTQRFASGRALRRAADMRSPHSTHAPSALTSTIAGGASGTDSASTESSRLGCNRTAALVRVISAERSLSRVSTRSSSNPVKNPSSRLIRSPLRPPPPLSRQDLSVGCARMSRVAVVTDTTGYMPAGLVRANGIHLVSLYVNFGGERTVREADITDYGEFYEELRKSDSLPTTSQPAVGDFLAVYEPWLDDGKDILSVRISGGLSGTCDAARQAVETLERGGRGGRVRVFDSATGAGGIALVTLAAAKAAQKGADLDAVERAAREA